ncbi:MAG: PAS domain-containing protein [Planctomycetes bacterium]|nr:PAS domain-containing protein [Planctomycetota bacterium]
MSDDDFQKPSNVTPKLLGAAIAFLGGVVAISWYLNKLELVTVPTQWVSMQYNTAVGFVLVGLAVVAHCVGRKRFAFLCGALAAGIGSVALAEQLLGRELHIVDALFLDGSGSFQFDMAPNTALCFAVAGCLILVYRAPRSRRRWREMASGVLAAMLTAAGFVGLLNFVLNDGVETGFARFTQMELHTALAFLGLGVAFFVMIGHFGTDSMQRKLPAWSPWAAGLGVGALVLAVWLGLTSSDQRLRQMSTTKTHEAAVTHANQLLQNHLHEVDKLARLVAHSLNGPEADLRADVEVFTSGMPGLVGMAHVECDGSIGYTTDAGPDWARQVLALADVQDALARSRSEGGTAVAGPITTGDFPQSLFVVVPVVWQGEPRGELVFQDAVQPFFDAIFAEGVGRTFDVELFDQDNRSFYRSYDVYWAPTRHVSSLVAHTERATGKVAFGDRIWTIRGAVGAPWMPGARSAGNTLILWIGLFLAVSIAFAVRKSELLRERAYSLADANSTIEKGVVNLQEANARLDERRRDLEAAEERLRRAVREKRRILDSLSAFLVGVDGDGVVTEWNFNSSELFGLSSGAALGRPFEDLELPWDRIDVLDAVSECLASGQRIKRDNFTVTGETENDSRVVSFTVNPAQDGDSRRGFSIIGADVTERNMLEIQLHQAQKLESVGTLAAGIAHEINTPMQFVSDNVRFLSQQVESITDLLKMQAELLARLDEAGVDDERVRAARLLVDSMDVDFVADEMPLAINETLEGVERVTTIVKAMKDFSHPGDQSVAASDLNKAIETTLQVARNEYKYIVDVTTDFGDLPMVECWVGDLNQVFLNLLVNGTHAIREKLGDNSTEKGTIAISTRVDGECVEIRFTDSGTGIPEEARAHVFEQFYTTKEIGRGTGLGLAIARAVVVDKHGGDLRFETEMDVGTTFIVRVPVRQKPAEATIDDTCPLRG